MGDNKIPLVHRDDLPYEDAESIVSALKDKFPGYTVRFAGDSPEGSIPEDVKEYMASVERILAASLANGQCKDCGKVMENWPPDDDDWELEEGWSRYYLAGSSGKSGFFMCPKCQECTPEI